MPATAIPIRRATLPVQDQPNGPATSGRPCRVWARFFRPQPVQAGIAGMLLVLVFPLFRISAAEPRGTWWWTSAGHPWGVDQVVGDNNKEIQMLQFLKGWNFGRIYASFGSRALTNPAAMRAWNARLHASGIAKQLLLSENTWIFPQNRDKLLTVHIQTKLLDFNAAAASAEAALPEIRRLRPHLVLIDITLPGRSGLQLIREIRRRDGAVKLLVVSMHDEAVYAERVLRAGGDGYIMQEEGAQEIVRAVRDVLLGRIYVSEEVLAAGRPSTPRGNRRASLRLLDRPADDEVRLAGTAGPRIGYVRDGRRTGHSRFTSATAVSWHSPETGIEERGQPGPLRGLLGREREGIIRRPVQSWLKFLR